MLKMDIDMLLKNILYLLVVVFNNNYGNYFYVSFVVITTYKVPSKVVE